MAAPTPGRAERFTLQLLGGFCLRRDDHVVHVAPTCQRVVAMAALAAPAAVARATVRATLWADVDERQGSANLRTALWRLGRGCPGVVGVDEGRLWLSPEVTLDLTAVPTRRGGILSFDLLPGWYDEWLAPERERIRQLRLHLHEELAQRCLAAADTAQAIDLALQAVALEPLRESSHRLLIAAHLQEGNVVEALLQFERCRTVLRDELGVAPSRALVALVARGAVGSRDAAVTA